MPYFSRKISENKVCVYKKDTNEKVGCTTPAKLDKYMKALHVNEPKNVIKKPIFNYIQDIDESGIATLYIYDTIGAYFDPETEKVKCTINGKDFAKEMEYLQDKAKLICIRINSGGGNVLDGYGIIDSILSSKVPVHTYNVGIAASIASLIFLAGHRRIMNDYSTLMIHNPSMAENENSKLLNVIKKQLVTFLANNCIYSQQELSDLMDEETYFDAEECIESGLVDEINNTGRNIPKMEKTNVLEMANIYNQLLLKDKDMKKVKNTAEETDKDFTTKKEKVAIKNKKKLKEAEKEEEESETEAEQKREDKEGLEKAEPVHQDDKEETKTIVDDEEEMSKVDDDDSDAEMADDRMSDEDEEDGEEEEEDDDVYDSMDDAKEKIKTLKEELKKFKGIVADYEAKAEKAEMERIDNMLSQYVNVGAIKNEELGDLRKLAKVNFDSVNNMLSKIGTTVTKQKSVVNKEAVKIFNTVTNQPTSVTGKESWTIRDWEKKDPKGLDKIKNETPELYNNMFSAYYKK